MPRHDDPTEIEPRPQPPPDTGPDATTSQLEQDIDSGATGDKVPMFDPSASPLGTDAEAGGTPPAPAEVVTARATERAKRRSPEQPFDRAADLAWLRPASGLAILVLLGLLAVWLGFS